MKNNWQTKKIEEICDYFGDGDWVESKDQSPEGIRLIQTGNVGEGVFKDRAEKARYISEATFKRLRCTEIFEGDCLISRLPDPAGRSCIIPDTGERMITAVDCTIIRFDSKQVIPEFFNYYTQSLAYLKDVDTETTGTTRKRISRSKLGEVKIPLLPLPEQHRIVAMLDKAFEAIATAKANAEKNLKNARELFESYLNRVFTQRGKGWVEKRLGDMATFRNGINFTKSSKGDLIKILGVKDFQNNYWAPIDDLDSIIPDGDVPDTDTIQQNDLVFVRSNGNPELIGRCLLIGETRERTTHSGFTIKARLNTPDVVPIFLCHFLKSSLVRREMIDGGNGVNIKSLNQGTLSRLRIPFPSQTTQVDIVERFEVLQSETQRLSSLYQQRLKALDELKKSILHQAFSGEL